MKTEDFSKSNNDNCQPEIIENLMGRREVISKAGLFALSAATMMVLLKSQPAMAQSNPAPNVYIAPTDGRTEVWQRTTRK